MKRIILLVSACLALLAASFTPAQAQQSYYLDFTGASTDCISWINGIGGGALNAFLSGGSDSVAASTLAGGTAPECSMSSMTAIYIQLNGFTATSFSMQVANMDYVALYLGGPAGGLVYSVSTVASGTISANVTYDTIELLTSSGSVFDNLLIGVPAPASTGVVTTPRINVGDWGSPVALYCAPGGGLDIYDISGDQGVLAHRISDQVIANSLATAATSGNNVRLINDTDAQVWALASGQLQVNTGGYAYGFAYQGVCGALPEPDFSSSLSFDEEDFGVIISRPR